MIKDLSEKLTILILTYNRYYHLMRLMRYIDSVKSPFKIGILDSSSEPVDVNEDEFQQLIERNNICWTKYDPNIHPVQKIIEGLKTVRTPYVVLWADDDFLIPHSLEKGVAFLEKNRDFSIVHGQSGLYVMQSSSDKVKISSLGYYAQRSIDNRFAAERLINHLSSYSVTFYSIHRTEDMKNNFNLCRSYEIGLKFDELMLSCLSIIQGKTMKMNCLYMLRERHESIDAWSKFIAHKTNQCNYGTKKNDFFDMIVGEEFNKNYKKFSDCLSEELIKQDGIKKDEAVAAVKQAYWAYLSKGLILTYQRRFAEKGLTTRIKRSLKRFPFVVGRLLPIWQAVRYMRYKIFSSDRMALPALLSSASPYYNDFLPIYRAITTPTQSKEFAK